MVAIPLTIIFSVVNCFTTSIFGFFLLRFLTTLAFGGILAVTVIYLTESMPDDKWGKFNFLMEIIWQVGVLVCTILALISNGSWWFLILAPAFLILICFVLIYLYLDESSRFMLSANNIEGVVSYLNHLAEVNKKDIKVSYLHYEDLDGKHEV